MSKTEINDVAPSKLSDLVGQRGVVEQVKVAIDAARADNRRMDHALFLGPPGMGKSQVARCICEEMGTGYVEVLGQSIKTDADFNALLLKAKDRDLIFVDEIHEMNKSFQTKLYLALDQRRIVASTGKTMIFLQISDFTLLGATSEEYCILQPLRDRMRLTLRYNYYSESELDLIIRNRADSLEWIIERKILPEISRRSRGTPRLALRLLQSARRVSRSENEVTIRLEHLRRACELESIDSLGLGPVEQKYIQQLSEGPLRLNVLASIIGLPARTISEVTEPFLQRIGLICKNEQGLRQLTQSGHDHLLCQEP